MDLEVARADCHLHPVAVTAGLGERPRHRRLAHAEETEDAAPGRLGAREQRAERVRLERGRPEAAQLRRRPRQDHRDASAILREQQPRCGAGEAEHERAVRDRRLLRDAGGEVGVVPLQPLRRRARHGLDLPLELLVDVETEAERLRDHLDGAIVVRRAETARDEARVGGQTLAERRLELVSRVTDDVDPCGLETQPQRLAREERAVEIGAFATHELAARDDDDRARPAQ